MPDEFPAYWAMAETYLWPGKEPPHPLARSGHARQDRPDLALDAGRAAAWTARDEALKQGRWRRLRGTHREGTFPGREDLGQRHRPRDPTARPARPSCRSHPATPVTAPASMSPRPPRCRIKDQQVQDLEDFAPPRRPCTSAVGQRRQVPEGEPARWTADLTVRHEVHPAADSAARSSCAAPRRPSCATPWTAPTPKRGPFTRSHSKSARQAAPSTGLRQGRRGQKDGGLPDPASGDKTGADRSIPNRPGWPRPSGSALDTTDKVFRRHQPLQGPSRRRASRACGSRLGEGENTVTVRFKEREVTAAMIEGVVNSLRASLERRPGAGRTSRSRTASSLILVCRSRSSPRSRASNSSLAT